MVVIVVPVAVAAVAVAGAMVVPLVLVVDMGAVDVVDVVVVWSRRLVCH